MQLKQVLVGLDDSAAAATAARWAAEAVRETGGEVVAVHCLDTSVVRLAVESVIRGLGVPPTDILNWKQEIRDLLEADWAQPLRDAGVPYRTLLVEGDPVHALLDTARDLDVDLIVVGHQGGTTFLHRLFGHVSDELLDHASRPVVVVPLSPVSEAPDD
ncbi:MAG: universal stress protein [Actinomycetota bacterium]